MIAKNFTFTEFCLGNKWSLTWDRAKWTGDNCHGKKKDVEWSTSHIDESSKNMVLYLHKDYVDSIEDISLDPKTNLFDYIIKNQFYQITPRPDAATTLYTDFTITSSKVITADNITTMRCDLKLVTNTFDVVNVSVKDITFNM